MRKFRLSIVTILMSLVLIACISCATDTAWRKATVTTYELIGDGIGSAKDTVVVLKAQNLISDENVAKAKELYNKAQKIFVTMGNTLKAAGKAENAAKKDELLIQYDALLKEFKILSYEIYNLIKNIKK